MTPTEALSRITFSSEDTEAYENLAIGIAEVSNQAIANLVAMGTISALKGEVSTMQRAEAELEATLNPLILRPIILNSRCDICPI